MKWILRNIPKTFCFVAIFVTLLTMGNKGFGQTNGDYRTRANGNWNAINTWSIYDGGWRNAVAGDGYPGQNAGTGTVTIQNNQNVTLNVSPPNPIAALVLATGNRASYITFNGINSLTVTGATTIEIPTNTNTARYKYIRVLAGSFTTASIVMNASAADGRDSYIEISTGSVTVEGDITMNGSNLRNYILFTGDGTLNVGGTITGGGITNTLNGGNNPPTSGTVNYNNAGVQPIGAYTYYNLTLSGSGAKTLSGATIINSNLLITGSATVTPTATLAVSGTTTLSGTSVLTLGANNILSSTPIVLNGGTFSTGATTGYGETVGTLNLNNNSTIALGTGDHTLTFANSSAIGWAGNTLTITGWTGTAGSSGTAGKIVVGEGGLSTTQLAKISFDGYSAGAMIVSGEVVPLSTDPVLFVTPSSIDFGYVASGDNSSVETYALSGANLTGFPDDITVTAPSNFQVSTNGTDFFTSVDVAYTSGTLSSTTIHVRFQPTAPNTTYSGDISNAGGGATTENVSVEGNSIISYCPSSGNLAFATAITLVEFNTINNSTGKTNPYEDYTSISTTVTKGLSYNLTVNLILL